MPDFYFFSHPAALKPQPPDMAFGPIPGAAATQFRVCSRHAPNGVAPVFAVCDGHIAVREVAANGTLAIVLRPMQQPGHKLPHLRYFLYRGVDPSSLLAGTNIAPPNTNRLTTSIWTNLRKFQQSQSDANAGTSNQPPGREFLGLDQARTRLNPTDPVEWLFTTETSFQSPLVRAGWHIGNFGATVGFEVVLDGAGLDIPLSILDQPDHVISVPGLPANPSDAQRLLHRYRTEEVLSYLDPCALYGAFYGSRLLVVQVPAGGSPGQPTEIPGSDIYPNILGPVFANPSRVYIDIRNERNRSFNAYHNYRDTFQLGIGNASPSRDFYESGWPIFILDKNDFAGHNPRDPFLTLSISLSRGYRGGQPGKENEEPVLFVSRGFSRRRFPKELDNDKQFAMPGFENDLRLKPLRMIVPRHVAAAAPTPVSQFLQVKYCKGYDWCQYPRESYGTVIQSGDFMDNLFPVFDMHLATPRRDAKGTRVYHAALFVDDFSNLPYPMALSVGIAKDGSRTWLFAFPSAIYYPDPLVHKQTPGITSGLTSAAGAIAQSLLFQPLPLVVKDLVVQEGSQPPKKAIRLAREFPSLKPSVRNIPPDHFFAFALADSELDELRRYHNQSVQASEITADFPVYLGLRLRSRSLDDNGRKKREFQVVLTGYRYDGTDYSVISVPTRIDVIVTENTD